MANICWFEMRVRGTKTNCYEFFNSDIRCYEMNLSRTDGTEKDYMMYIRGECPGSVWGSMVCNSDETLAEKAAKWNLELEVCGYEDGCDTSERLHYKGTEVLKENILPFCLREWEFEEMGLPDTDLTKYEKDEERDMYFLKSEYAEHFAYDEEKGEAVFTFTMSFDDLRKQK